MPKHPPIPEDLTHVDARKMIEGWRRERELADHKIDALRRQLETLSALLETEEEQEKTREWLEKSLREVYG